MSEGRIKALNSRLDLTCLAHEFGRDMYRLAYGIVHDAQLAEDACQQAFVKLWERRREVDNPRAWLVRVTVNECITTLRRRREVSVTRDVAADQRTAEDVHALKDQVLWALAQIPERERQVVILRVMQEMSGNEVMQMLDCSAAEVSRRLHAGLEKLREVLKHGGETG